MIIEIEKTTWKLLELAKGEVDLGQALELVAAISSLKFLETYNTKLKKEQHFINYILKNETSLVDGLKQAFNKIEEVVPSLKGVYRNLKVFDEELSSATLYQVLLQINAINWEQIEWKIFSDLLIKSVSSSRGKAGVEGLIPESIVDLSISLLSMQNGSFYHGRANYVRSLCKVNDYAKLKNKDICLFAQEANQKKWAIGKIRLLMHGIENVQFELGDPLLEPAFIDEGNKLKKFKYIMMDYPFNLRIDDYDKILEDQYNRFIYGNPPKNRVDMAFISHVLSSLDENGKAVIITVDGTLFRGGSEELIRRNMLFADVIEAVIALPAKLYEVTSIPVNIIVFNKNKPKNRKNKILFINANKHFGELKRNQRFLRPTDIEEINKAYQNGLEIEEFSKFVDIKDIQNANLLSSRYLIASEMKIEPYGTVEVNMEHFKENVEYGQLGKLAKFYRGINVSSKDAESEEGKFKVIKLSDVQDGKLNVEELANYCIEGNVKIESYLVEKDDVIISSRGAGIKVAVIPEHDQPVLLSHNFIGIRLNRTINPYYLKEYLESPIGQFLIANRQSGTSITTLAAKDLNDLPIPMLSTDEQIKIISSYKFEQQKIQQEIGRLQEELKASRMNLYKKMGIKSSFTIK